jgi:hypothetical protein
MTTPSSESRTHQTEQGMVWIEDEGGTIVRGQVDAATADGAHVRLKETPSFRAGDQVELRICLAPGQPTFATRARIAWLRPGDRIVECGLEWSAGHEERAALDAWLAGAAA